MSSLRAPSQNGPYKNRIHIVCWRHTVPKYTSDGHTNMKILISREVGPDISRKPVYNRRNFDSYRRAHDKHTKASRLHPTQSRSHIQVDIFPKKLIGRAHEGHAIDTQCQNVNTMCAKLVAKASRL